MSELSGAETPAILVLNAGSSTLKFRVFAVGTRREFLRGHCDYQIEPLTVQFRSSPDGHSVSVPVLGQVANQADRVDSVLRTILHQVQTDQWTLTAIGHRVVHGGPHLSQPVIVSPTVVQELHRWVSWAPLHQADCLAVIESISRAVVNVPQVACFDTGFHATMPTTASTYALPRSLTAAGIRRYGFHGLSYQSISEQLREIDPSAANGRVVVAHLGSGASLCGMVGGQSQATTMGLTPLDGLPMATRCGALDPGILLHLLQQDLVSVPSLVELLYRESGLQGVSGISGDVRTLLESSSPAAREALDLFVYRIVCEIGSIVAAMQGWEALVFTGGIGENSTEIRKRVCQQLQWWGVDLDPDANQRARPSDWATATHKCRIDHRRGPIRIYVIPTAEEALIARLTWETVTAAQRGASDHFPELPR